MDKVVDEEEDKVVDKDNDDVTLSVIRFDLSNLEKEKSNHGLISTSALMFFLFSHQDNKDTQNPLHKIMMFVCSRMLRIQV